MTLPRGLRNLNPGNIETSGWTVRQPGYLGPEPEGRFARFATMGDGLAAMYRLLLVYRDEHGLRTIRSILDRWAPSSDGNNVSAYAAHVAKITGYGVDDVLPETPAAIASVAFAMACHENGEAAARAGISPSDIAAAGVAVFGTGVAVDAGGEPSSPPTTPPPGQPVSSSSERSFKMPPFVAVAAPILFEFVADLFRSHGSKTSTRNADLIEKAGPAIVEIAKTVSGATTAEAAVEKIAADATTREQFRAAVERDLDRLVGFVERMSALDEAGFAAAAERARGDAVVNAETPLMIRWMLGLLTGSLVGVFAVMVLQVVYAPDHRPMPELVVLFVSVVSMILGTVSTIYAYRFSSSVGSKASGDALRDLASTASRPPSR